MSGAVKWLLGGSLCVVLAVAAIIGVSALTNDPAQAAVDKAQAVCNEYGDNDPQCVALKLKARAMYDAEHKEDTP